MLNHDKPHLKRIAEEEGYKPEELIAAERIKVYIAENSTLVPANIDPEMGIEARSFDTTIEDMNRIQEAGLGRRMKTDIEILREMFKASAIEPLEKQNSQRNQLIGR
jgi:hypothetical protein